MTDRPPSVQIKAFEHVLAAPGIALLRVQAGLPRRRNSPARPNLVIDDEQVTHRFAPLPAPDDPRGVLRVAYSVPIELLERAFTFTLEFETGGPLKLSQPTAGSMRLMGHTGKQDAGQPGTAEARPDATLDQDRRTDVHEKLVKQSQALAEAERAATARDRAQRRAQAKLQAELKASQEEEQRAWARVGELEQQAASANARAETAERRIPELEAAAHDHAQRNAELERRRQQMTQDLATAESERAGLVEQLEHMGDALRVMTFERDELMRQVSAHDSVAVKARERAAEAETAHADASEALRELEIWREELERRLAGLTDELSATKQAFEVAEGERRRLEGALAESDATNELAEGRNATLRAQVAELTSQLSERDVELADAVRAADGSSALAEAHRLRDELDAAQAERERLSAELNALRVSQAQAQATLATLRLELEQARLDAARSADLEREVEASRREADRLQTAVLRLESEIRSLGHGPADPLRNGSEREPAAVSSALHGAREEMNALRRELEVALASERRANLELVMLTAETQARLQAQIELKQAARESGLSP